MTLAPPTEPQTLVDLDAPEPDLREPVTLAHIRAAAVRVVLVAVTVVAVIAFFEGPLSGVWYRARQRQLLTELKTPHAGLKLGQAVALLQIPRSAQNLVVVLGDEPAQLRSGPGLVPGTPIPGRRGNSIIVGHRSGWGGPFGSLTQLHKNDHLVAQNRGGKAVVYTVTTIKHVSASNTNYTVRTKDYRLTLITGDGSLLGNGRLVVQAVSGNTYPTPRKHGPVVHLSHGSLVLNWAAGIAVAAFALALLAAGYLRRHYGVGALFAVLVPLLAGGLLALLLDLDQLLPPLR